MPISIMRMCSPVFTRGIICRTKFGYDKRKCYLSNEILAGTKAREDALIELEQPGYDEQTMRADLEYIAAKLDMKRRAA